MKINSIGGFVISFFYCYIVVGVVDSGSYYTKNGLLAISGNDDSEEYDAEIYGWPTLNTSKENAKLNHTYGGHWKLDQLINQLGVSIVKQRAVSTTEQMTLSTSKFVTPNSIYPITGGYNVKTTNESIRLNSLNSIIAKNFQYYQYGTLPNQNEQFDDVANKSDVFFKNKQQQQKMDKMESATMSNWFEKPIIPITQSNRRIPNKDSGDEIAKILSAERGAVPALSTLSSHPLTVARSNNQSKDDYIKANEHYRQMLKETVCKIPRPKVIKISDVYPDPNKIYSPSCTVLHQCSDDTGCCTDETKRCAPYKSTNVTLYFLVTVSLQAQNKNNKLTTSYEALSFNNYTECRCQIKSEESMPRDTAFIVPRTERSINMTYFNNII